MGRGGLSVCAVCAGSLASLALTPVTLLSAPPWAPSGGNDSLQRRLKQRRENKQVLRGVSKAALWQGTQNGSLCMFSLSDPSLHREQGRLSLPQDISIHLVLITFMMNYIYD